MSDVQRLIDRLNKGATWNGDWKHEAADALTAQADEIERLREALEDHACGCKRQCADCAVEEATGVVDNGWKARAVLDHKPTTPIEPITPLSIIE